MSSIRNLLIPANENHTEPRAEEVEDTERINNMPEMTHFTVEFILDVVCPYCYIGLKNMNTAMEIYKTRHPEATFEVTCSPFFLQPLAARSSYAKSEFPVAQSHTPEHWARLGEPAGITFSWQGRTGNTRDAHKLLRLALERTPTTTRSTAFAARSNGVSDGAPASPGGTNNNNNHNHNHNNNHNNNDNNHNTTNGTRSPRGPALQLRLLEALFHAHHETDGDVSDRAFLAATCAAATGLAADEVRGALESAAWGRAVDALVADVIARRGLGVRAVPTFVVNGRYVVGGAQSAEFLVAEFERICRLGGGGGRRRERE